MRGSRNRKYDRFINLYLEFHDYLKEYQGFFLDSKLGYWLMHRIISKKDAKIKKALHEREKQYLKEIQDSCTFDYEKNANAYIPGAGDLIYKTGQIRKRIIRNGCNQEILTKTFIVNLAAYWEVYFREKVAEAYGYKNKNDYQDNNWGYFIALRNSILHNKCRVDQKLYTRAKSVGKVFELNEQVNFGEEFICEIFSKAHAFLDDLHKESMPKPRVKLEIPESIIDITRTKDFRKKKYGSG